MIDLTTTNSHSPEKNKFLPIINTIYNVCSFQNSANNSTQPDNLQPLPNKPIIYAYMNPGNHLLHNKPQPTTQLKRTGHRRQMRVTSKKLKNLK